MNDGKKAVKIKVKKGNPTTGKPYVFEVESSKNLFFYTHARGSKKGKSNKHNFGHHYVRRKLKSSKVYDFRVKSKGKKLDWFWNREKKSFSPDTTSPSFVFIKHMPDFEKKVSKKMEELIGKAFYS